MADRVAVMNAGKVVQVGEPEAVYNRPVTRFVADFLGEANFVPGAIIGAVGAAARVATPVGELRAEGDWRRSPDSVGAKAPVPAVSGHSVLCCIRPERIAISAANDADRRLGGEARRAGTALAPVPCTRIPATVAESVYLGEMRQYLCDLPGGQRWKVSVLAGSERAFAAGSAVTLRVAARDVALLPGQ